jgi:hypothetical protein
MHRFHLRAHHLDLAAVPGAEFEPLLSVVQGKLVSLVVASAFPLSIASRATCEVTPTRFPFVLLGCLEGWAYM